MLGEIRENNKGTKMIIIAQRGCDDIDVEFLDSHHYVFRHATYSNFKKGCIKNPFDKTIYGMGCIGDGKYTGWINGDRKTSWSYERDGKFVRDPSDRRASDLVKVIRNGSN